MRTALRRQDVVPGTESVSVGDIDGNTNWSLALEGADVVYHLAALVHARKENVDDAGYRRSNVEGTVALARAAASAGVGHFVFVSSVKAIAESNFGKPLRETDPPRAADAYGRSKWQAEEGLNALRNKSMRVSILRPPLVYGPGVSANFLRLMQAIDRHLPLPFGRIQNRRSIIYVGNLVDAMIACVRAGDAGSATYHVSDGVEVSTPQLVRLIAKSLRRRPILLPVPVSLLVAAGAAVGRRDAINRLIESLTLDSTAIQRNLGWTPPFEMEQGFAITADWYRQR